MLAHYVTLGFVIWFKFITFRNLLKATSKLLNKFLTIVFLFLLSVNCKATHLMGGSMTYAYNGVDLATGKDKFHVTLKILVLNV